uniref:Pirin family protein n=1 Tax=candidate division WOR-3 bacterium TaxID=2052148 RepID=A0A7C2P9P1_UNCW3
MENVRKVSRKVVAVETFEGAGARVKRLFPTSQLRHFDPFVLLDEFLVEPPAGFPSHPHRGFEAITYMLEGGFHHTDDLGNDSVVLAGGLQKFTAGRGIVRPELPGTKGLNRGLQLWVRLPSKLGNVKPDYQQIESNSVPEREMDGLRIRVIAGENSLVKMYTKIIYLDVISRKRGYFVYQVEPEANVFIYTLEGNLAIADSTVKKGEAALLTTGNKVEIKTQRRILDLCL